MTAKPKTRIGIHPIVQGEWYRLSESKPGQRQWMVWYYLDDDRSNPDKLVSLCAGADDFEHSYLDGTLPKDVYWMPAEICPPPPPELTQ